MIVASEALRDDQRATAIAHGGKELRIVVK